MSLFERIKNKRLSLQEKKEDKTDRSVKQSEVSKQAKKFTRKINQKNINRPEGIIGDTYVSTDKKGKIRSAKKVNPTLKKSVSQVKADIEFKQGLQKVRKFAGQKGTGELSDKAPQKVRKFVQDTRSKRIKDLGLPDTSFDAKDKFSQKKFDKSIKSLSKGPKINIPNPFKGATGKATKGAATKLEFQPKTNKASQAAEKTQKSFAQFGKDLKKAKANIEIEKKVNRPSYKIKSSSTSSGGSSSSSGGGRRINKKFSQGNTFNQTSGGFSGGGKPPKPPKGSGGSLVPPGGGSGGSGGVDPDGVFKGKIPNKGGMSNKQFKKFRKDQKKMFKKFMNQAKGAQTNASNVYNVGRRSRTGFEAINLAKKIGKKRAGPLKRAAGFLATKAIKHPVGALAALGVAGLGIYGAKRLLAPNVKKENDVFKNSKFVGKVSYAKGKKAGQPVLVGSDNRTNPPGISKSQRKGFVTKYRKDDPKTQRNIHKGLMSGDLNLVKNKKVQKIVGGDGKYKIAK